MSAEKKLDAYVQLGEIWTGTQQTVEDEGSSSSVEAGAEAVANVVSASNSSSDSEEPRPKSKSTSEKLMTETPTSGQSSMGPVLTKKKTRHRLFAAPRMSIQLSSFSTALAVRHEQRESEDTLHFLMANDSPQLDACVDTLIANMRSMVQTPKDKMESGKILATSSELKAVGTVEADLDAAADSKQMDEDMQAIGGDDMAVDGVLQLPDSALVSSSIGTVDTVDTLENMHLDDIVSGLKAMDSEVFAEFVAHCEQRAVEPLTALECLREVLLSMLDTDTALMEQNMVYLPVSVENIHVPFGSGIDDTRSNKEKIAQALEGDLSEDVVEWLHGFELQPIVDDGKSSFFGSLAAFTYGKCQGCFHSVPAKSALRYVAPTVKDSFEKDISDEGVNGVFLFHDEYCVQLRRLKECIRQHVFRSNLSAQLETELDIDDKPDAIGMISAMFQFKDMVMPISREEGSIERPSVPSVAAGWMGTVGRTAGIIGAGALSLVATVSTDDSHDVVGMMLKARERRSAAMHLLLAKRSSRTGWLPEVYDGLPSVLRRCDVLTYGPSLFAFCLQMLQGKDHATIWKVMCHLAAMMPATVTAELLRQFKRLLVKFELRHLDDMCRATVQVSEFPSATALYFAAFMKGLATIEANREKEMRELSQKYIQVAIDLLQAIESDHLLAMCCEVRSDVSGLSIFETALHFELETFFSWHRLQPISNQMWYRVGVLDPSTTFPLSDWTALEVSKKLVKSPARFYYSGLGRFVTATSIYLLYLALWTWYSVQNSSGNKGCHGKSRERCHSKTSQDFKWEIGLAAANVGYVGYELVQLYVEGLDAYFNSVLNRLDAAICGIWIGYHLVRFDEKWQDILLCVQLVLLWLRLAFIVRGMSRSLATLFAMVKSMMVDILNFLLLLALLSFGFVFAINFIVEDSLKRSNCEEMGIDGLFDVSFYLFQTLVGQQEWGPLTDNSCFDENWRKQTTKFLIAVYSVLGAILLLNLLIALMASTYERLQERASLQSTFTVFQVAYEFSHDFALLTAPFNLLVFFVAALAGAADAAVKLVTGGVLTANPLALNPLNIHYDSAHPKPRQFCCRKTLRSEEFSVWQHTKQSLMSWRNKEFAMICKFCRGEVVVSDASQNVERYFPLLERQRAVDESDKNLLRRLLKGKRMCDNCFRPLGAGDTLHGWQLMLEVLSFVLYMCILWPLLCILSLLPYAFGWLKHAAKKSQKGRHSAAALARMPTTSLDYVSVDYHQHVDSVFSAQS